MNCFSHSAIGTNSIAQSMKVSRQQPTPHPRVSDRIRATAAAAHRLLQSWLKASFLAAMFDTYRPERHYMRGSGPKARALASRGDADLPQPR